MMTPEAFADDFIFRWEDGKSNDPAKTHSMRRNDRGNWTGGAIGAGKLIGSNHGVTPVALAAYRRVSVDEISVAVMHALTRPEAARIAIANYLRSPGFDRLDWSPLIASVFDFGWGAGPGTSARKLQGLVGVNPDGAIGMLTDGATDKYVAKHGIEETCRRFAAVRLAYYEAVIEAHPEQAENRNGWRNRTNYFLSGDPEGWWKRFNA